MRPGDKTLIVVPFSHNYTFLMEFQISIVETFYKTVIPVKVDYFTTKYRKLCNKYKKVLVCS